MTESSDLYKKYPTVYNARDKIAEKLRGGIPIINVPFTETPVEELKGFEMPSQAEGYLHFQATLYEMTPADSPLRKMGLHEVIREAQRAREMEEKYQALRLWITNKILDGTIK